MNKILVLASLFMVASLGLLAQNSNISIQRDSVKLKTLISELEKISDIHFFYKEEWGDSVLLDLNITQKTLHQTLNIVSEQSDINFCYIDDSTIVVSNNYTIKTNYGDAYRDYLSSKTIFRRDTVEYKAPTRVLPDEKIVNPEYQTYKIGSPSKNKNVKTATLTGFIKDSESGESLVGSVVYLSELDKGCVSNAFGSYTITIPKGQYRLEYRSLGMRTTHRNINLYSDGTLNVDLKSKPTALNEVTVRAGADDKVKNLRMGVEKISVKSLKRLPAGFGEADIIKGTLLLPGVQAVSEASAGFNVRGGSADQNLILLSGAPIVNTSHFFGFFSGFNADIIKDVTLIKSSIPAKYGGRASSVMDIELKDGNRKNLNISGGISPVSGRITIDSPIKKDKSSFIIGARSTYSNWVLNLLDDVKLKNSSAGFYDIQGNFSFDLNENNKLYVSGYKSHDNFDYYKEDAYLYNTMASSVKWQRTFSPKLFSVFTAVVSHYDYSMEAQQDSVLQNEVLYALKQYALKSDFTYHTANNHKLDFGLHSTWYNLAPGERVPAGNWSLISAKKLEHERATETSLYISDEFDVTHFMSLSGGIRYTAYANIGAKTQVDYLEGRPRTLDNMAGTTNFKAREVVKFYAYPELRLASNFTFSNTTSIKLGVSRMFQYIQMISNTAAMSPTDIWKLSDNYIKPLRSDQYSIGLYKKLGDKYVFTAEAYYKSLKNIIDYKGGAQLVMNEHLETDVLNGKGKAYGAEFMLEKKKGRLTGWVNYTYARVLHKIETNFDEEMVNNGEYFPANYDKPHDLNISANFKANRRINLSSSFFYSSGRPFTAPVAYYKFKDYVRPFYSQRNELRMEDYIRWDVAATVHGNLIKKKLNHSSWTFSVHNLLGRKNPYSIYFRTESNTVNGYKMSIYGQPIYTITYNFKFMGNAKDDF